MKKLLSLMAVLFLAAGCTTNSPKPEATPTPEPEKTPVTESGSYKAGTASIVSFKNNEAGEKEGSIQINTTIASVVLDETGKIAFVDIDVLQEAGKFDTKGVVNADASVAVASKKGLKDDYGMVKASKIGKEWYQQAEALESWMTGKTLEEVMALPVSDEGKTTDTDLMTSVTVGVTDYLKAVELAATNAKEVAKAEKYGVANEASIKTADALEKDGSVQVTATYVLTGFDAEGKVVFTILDAAQNTGYFTVEGKINEEATVVRGTKKEIKEEYGMAKASKIGKEWYQQAESFEAWTAMKTADEIASSKIGDDGKTMEEDLMTSCTMGIKGYTALIQQAATNAK